MIVINDREDVEVVAEGIWASSGAPRILSKGGPTVANSEPPGGWGRSPGKGGSGSLSRKFVKKCTPKTPFKLILIPFLKFQG